MLFYALDLGLAVGLGLYASVASRIYPDPRNAHLCSMLSAGSFLTLLSVCCGSLFVGRVLQKLRKSLPTWMYWTITIMAVLVNYSLPTTLRTLRWCLESPALMFLILVKSKSSVFSPEWAKAALTAAFSGSLLTPVLCQFGGFTSTPAIVLGLGLFGFWGMDSAGDAIRLLEDLWPQDHAENAVALRTPGTILNVDLHFVLVLFCSFQTSSFQQKDVGLGSYETPSSLK